MNKLNVSQIINYLIKVIFFKFATAKIDVSAGIFHSVFNFEEISNQSGIFPPYSVRVE